MWWSLFPHFGTTWHPNWAVAFKVALQLYQEIHTLSGTELGPLSSIFCQASSAWACSMRLQDPSPAPDAQRLAPARPEERH